MKERIKAIRKAQKMTQQEFADALHVSRDNIASYELGRRIPTQSAIHLMKMTFGVNENWILTGEGEMMEPPTRAQEVASITAQYFSEDDPLRLALTKTISELSADQIETMVSIAEKLVANIKKEDPAKGSSKTNDE